ncbi:hypothetical protein KJA15_00415 [Patescibacteria group bacterium]|nr:hypothetical protein [Patescibacteria group bacterium]
MNKKQEKKSETEEIIDLLKKLLIVELSRAGMTQRKIRKIVGTDINMVNKIAKHLKKK